MLAASAQFGVVGKSGMVKFDWDNVTFPVLGSYGVVDWRVTLIGVVMHCWVMGEVTSSSTWRESLMVTSPAELTVPVAVPGVTSEKVTLVVPVAFGGRIRLDRERRSADDTGQRVDRARDGDRIGQCGRWGVVLHLVGGLSRLVGRAQGERLCTTVTGIE